MNELEEYIDTDEDVPFVFTDNGDKGKAIDEVSSAFVRIFQENDSGHQLVCPDIIDLGQLFYDLQLKAANQYGNKPFETVNEASKELYKNSDRYMEIGCDFHKCIDALFYCSYAR